MSQQMRPYPMQIPTPSRTRAQESRSAIARLYIAMRHLFIRGSYKPLGMSGEAMVESLMVLRPEIYGSITDPERVELDGLFYVFQRLPRGIEECRYVKLISREGFERTNFPPLVPARRRRNCYRIDEEQMFVEMTRGRSDIYDILTHLTFLYVEARKIYQNSVDHRGKKKREWVMLEQVVQKEEKGEEFNQEVAYTYLSTLLGRTYDETIAACSRFANEPNVNSIFHIAYWLGRLTAEEVREKKSREISFSSALRERIGHHAYGEVWAQAIKKTLTEHKLADRPVHIISANLHSVMNSLFAPAALARQVKDTGLDALARTLSLEESGDLRQRVFQYARRHGMIQLDDTSGTNISVQLFDTRRIDPSTLPPEIGWDADHIREAGPVLLVTDYAFGEQAYETMDELLKPMEEEGMKKNLNIASISIMGKAGILEGKKGDIMVPTAHVFEGTADNYPFENDLSPEDFREEGLKVFSGTMITVLGTSLQNRDILDYFLRSSWGAIGLEMEGAHFQKAIQSASKIRKSISEKITLRYAYYASDNPLITGHTLASGSLGLEGVKPTYLITRTLLNRILSGPPAQGRPSASASRRKPSR